MSQERILAVKKGGSYHVMAMQLLRRLDAVGAPYSIAVGRCVRAPAGLHLGLMVGGAQSYCVQTMRQTGDADQSRAAHKGGKKGGWGSGKGGSGGYRQQRDGWDHARSGWGGPAPAQAAQAAPAAAAAPPQAASAQQGPPPAQQGPPPPAQAASSQQDSPPAAPKASAAPAAQQEYWGNWWEDGSQWWDDHQNQYQDGGVDPYDDWAEDV